MVRKGRSPCCDKTKVKRGPWSPAEDARLISFIREHGHPNWRALPQQAGLLRCGKSCRLRWINYLRPDVKRGNFSPEEEQTIITLHKSMGNKWSMIAAQLPGRTDNEIKNVWNTHLKKKICRNGDTCSDFNRSKESSSSTGYSSSSSASSCISNSNSNNSNAEMMIMSNLDKGWSGLGSEGSQQFAAGIIKGDQNQVEPYSSKEDYSLSPDHSNISTVNDVNESLTGVDQEEEEEEVEEEEGKVSDEKNIMNHGVQLHSEDVEFWRWLECLMDEESCEFGGEEQYNSNYKQEQEQEQELELELEGESKERVGLKEYKKWLKELENELELCDEGGEGEGKQEHEEESANE